MRLVIFMAKGDERSGPAPQIVDIETSELHCNCDRRVTHHQPHFMFIMSVDKNDLFLYSTAGQDLCLELHNSRFVAI